MSATACITAALVLVIPWTAPHAQETDGGKPYRDAFVQWAAGRAVPLETLDPSAPSRDLSPIKAVVGDARIVCLGQSNRDAHEQFLFNHRMVKFLVEQMGFTLFALEENIAISKKVNAYLLKGDGDPAAILHEMGNWDVWDTEEMLALLKWLRAYDKNPAHKNKVRFYGFDMTDPYPGMADVLAYIEKVDPDYAMYMTRGPVDIAMLRANHWSELQGRYIHASGLTRQAFSGYLNDLLAQLDASRSGYVGRSSEAEYEWVRREVLSAMKANDMFTTGINGTYEETRNIREAAMVDNVNWLLNQVGKDERAIVWAHNFHISRECLDIQIPEVPAIVGMYPMGKFLGTEFGNAMVSIGFSYGQADYPGIPMPGATMESVDAALARVGKPLFLIDLRTAPEDGPVRTWLDSRHLMRGERGVSEVTPAGAYDALVFVQKITRTVPTAGARARLSAMPKAQE